MRIYRIVLFSLVMASCTGYSQGTSSDDVKWSATAFDNLTSNELLNSESYFIIRRDMIEWVQDNGSKGDDLCDR